MGNIRPSIFGLNTFGFKGNNNNNNNINNNKQVTNDEMCCCFNQELCEIHSAHLLHSQINSLKRYFRLSGVPLKLCKAAF